MALSAGIGLLGLAAAFVLYRGGLGGLPARLSASSLGLPFYRLLHGKYFVDEIYDFVIVKPLLRVSELVLHRFVDRLLIDTVMVGLPATVVEWSGRLLRLFQNGDVQRYAAAFAVGLAVLAAFVVVL